MSDRPIRFYAPEVRATLAGTKTQKRIVVKPWEPRISASPKAVPEDVAYLPDFTCYRSTCPYGQPGDRLWVRETSAAIEQPDGLDGVRYSADSAFRPIESTSEAADRWLAMNHYGGKRSVTVPAIHMPRWASRITLEITGVRVERLQDISEDDCWAEGIPYSPDVDPVHEYRALWESINGPGSWDANPWVWVVEFKPAAAALTQPEGGA